MNLIFAFGAASRIWSTIGCRFFDMAGTVMSLARSPRVPSLLVAAGVPSGSKHTTW